MNRFVFDETSMDRVLVLNAVYFELMEDWDIKGAVANKELDMSNLNHHLTHLKNSYRDRMLRATFSVFDVSAFVTKLINGRAAAACKNLWKTVAETRVIIVEKLQKTRAET